MGYDHPELIMSKVITSPVEKWPGTVTIADPLTLPQYAAWEEALPKIFGKTERGVSATELDVLPAIFKIVEKWDLTGFPTNPTIDNFPPKPALKRIALINWLANEITKLWLDDDEDPNA
jgi:hypothetical protein